MPKKKTSVYLDPEVDRQLAAVAQARGRSKAEVIRAALEREASKAPKQPRITAIGVGEGPGDVSENVDRYLAEDLPGD